MYFFESCSFYYICKTTPNRIAFILLALQGIAHLAHQQLNLFYLIGLTLIRQWISVCIQHPTMN